MLQYPNGETEALANRPTPSMANASMNIPKNIVTGIAPIALAKRRREMQGKGAYWRSVFAPTMHLSASADATTASVRAYLKDYDALNWSTTTLVEALWPLAEAEGRERQPLFDMLDKLKDTTLADCNLKAPPKSRYGKSFKYFPRLWSNPAYVKYEPPRCPTCGQTMPRAPEVTTAETHPASSGRSSEDQPSPA